MNLLHLVVIVTLSMIVVPFHKPVAHTWPQPVQRNAINYCVDRGGDKAACTCGITKAASQFSVGEVEQLFISYLRTHQVPVKAQAIVNECVKS